MPGPQYPPMAYDEAFGYLTQMLNYTEHETEAALRGAAAVDGNVYRRLALHDVTRVTGNGPHGPWHLGYLITAKPQADIVPALRRPDGPEIYKTDVYGDSYPAMIEAAEAEARAFYGPDARLAVVSAGPVYRSFTSRGTHWVSVTIRCENLPEGWIVP